MYGIRPLYQGKLQYFTNLNLAAILGWFPLLTMIPVRENSEVVIIYPDNIHNIHCYLTNIHQQYLTYLTWGLGSVLNWEMNIDEHEPDEPYINILYIYNYINFWTFWSGEWWQSIQLWVVTRCHKNRNPSMICSDELFLRSQWVVYQNYQIQWINNWVDCWWISVKNDAFCMRNTLRNIQVVQTQSSVCPLAISEQSSSSV